MPMMRGNFGNPADSMSPVALRPRLTTGLPLSVVVRGASLTPQDRLHQTASEPPMTEDKVPGCGVTLVPLAGEGDRTATARYLVHGSVSSTGVRGRAPRSAWNGLVPKSPILLGTNGSGLYQLHRLG